jgi:hypothetical protein
MTTLDTADPRFSKALVLADQVGSWLKIRDASGHCRAVGIRSSRGDRYYTVSRASCDCEDQQRHPDCKHRQALEIAIARETALPARLVLDGLAELARQRTRRYDEIFGKEV